MWAQEVSGNMLPLKWSFSAKTAPTTTAIGKLKSQPLTILTGCCHMEPFMDCMLLLTKLPTFERRQSVNQSVSVAAERRSLAKAHKPFLCDNIGRVIDAQSASGCFWVRQVGNKRMGSQSSQKLCLFRDNAQVGNQCSVSTKATFL